MKLATEVNWGPWECARVDGKYRVVRVEAGVKNDPIRQYARHPASKGLVQFDTPTAAIAYALFRNRGDRRDRKLKALKR